MRLKSVILGSTSFAALAMIASPAAAQPAAEQPADSAEAQEAPTDTDATGEVGTDAAEGEAIVVTGLRASLRSSQNIKRNSEQIVDSIVAEDIGKLPDIAVSDTAARIPGVQVERGGGEAGRVLVRGLPDFTTTYNGREIFTAETRVVALQDFPSGGIGAVEVFKTSTANLVEPGLAGLVNVRSRRPFDFRDGEIAGSVWGLYPRQSGDITPNGNLLITDRWEGGGGEFGALINFSYTRLHYLDSTRENTDFVADPVINGTRVRFPDIQRIFYGEGDRTRPSVNGALQWRPSPGTEFYVEGLWQGFRNRVSDRLLAVPLWGGQQYTNLTFRDGTNLLQSGTVTNPFRPDGFQGGTFNKTDTFQFAVGGSHEAGPLRISGDLARTDSQFTGSTASVDYAFANRQTVDFNLDVPTGDGGAEFSFRNFDPSVAANYIYRGFYEEAQVAKGDDWQARLDLQYDPEWSFLDRLEIGGRFTDRNAHREFGNRYYNFEGNRIPITSVPLDYQLFRSGFRGSDTQQLRTFLSPTYESIRANLAELRQFNRNLGGTVFGVNNDGPPPPDPQQTYDANERTWAGYGQVRYEFGDSVRFDGAVGVRVVRTELDIAGTSNVAGVLTPVSIDRAYTDYLPSANMRIRFNDQLQMRLSFAETRTRPNFAQLNPSASLGSPPTNCNPAGDPFTCARTGGGGNPFLNPFTSDNYDASLEYYFSRNGFASVAAFRRDLDGFFQNQEVRYIDPTLGPVIVNGPVNSGRGRIDGFEAQVTTFFDFASMPTWLNNFGIQANATYLDAETGFPNPAGGFDMDRIVGLSRWSYNLVGMYEGGGLSARLSYNWRSRFLTSRQNRGDDLYTEEAHPVSRLDLSTSYTLMESLTVFFDWTNILGDPFKSTLSSARAGAPRAEFPRFTRYEETVYSLGIRFRF